MKRACFILRLPEFVHGIRNIHCIRITYHLAITCPSYVTVLWYSSGLNRSCFCLASSLKKMGGKGPVSGAG